MRHTSATAALLASAVIGGLGLTPAAHAGAGPSPARAAWVKSCSGSDESTYPCGRWRLLLRDGSQQAVPDAAATRIDARGGEVRDPAVFAISADGRTIVYERAKDHRLVLRRTAGGATTALPRSVLPKGVGTDGVAVMLSADGGRVLVDYTGEGSVRNSKVIDARTGRTTEVPGKYAPHSFSADGDELLMTRFLSDNTLVMYSYGLADGHLVKRTPPQVVANANTYALAADGRTTAVFVAGDADRNRPPRVRVYDLATGELSAGANLPVKSAHGASLARWTTDGRLTAVVATHEEESAAVIRVLTVDPDSGAVRQTDSYRISKTRYTYYVAGE
ncbi:hypothetical protein HII36_48420 [Nonomuraea sp. NN258]|uniref:hypothetical protein n=1 Tax=Nonomuraea antri TaxID=2730852 RepID=UPI001568CF84|nr:hypothetical protein [Nonomuraea antri]NRQ39605.1 hypothetical protein [Nonomuraea antri]